MLLPPLCQLLPPMLLINNALPSCPLNANLGTMMAALNAAVPLSNIALPTVLMVSLAILAIKLSCKHMLQVAEKKTAALYDTGRVVKRKLQRTVARNSKLEAQIALLQSVELPAAKEDATTVTTSSTALVLPWS
jgi:hypothetical protein